MNESFRHFRGTNTYLTNDALESAVNCAIALERRYGGESAARPA